MEKETRPWPPAISFRRSQKARRIILRALPGKGLEIVLPGRASERMGRQVLEAHKPWVLRQLERLETEEKARAEARAGQDAGFFEAGAALLSLHGGAILLRLEWPLDKSRLTLRGDAEEAREIFPEEDAAEEKAGGRRRLICRLPDGDAGLRRLRLLRWLKDYAGKYFAGRVAELSARHGLSCSRLRLGLQKSRWGSCSRQGTICLNLKLIFLPLELSDAVILHELCHSRFLNHGPEFRGLLLRLDPASREKERRLRQARLWLPNWLE